MGRMRGLAQATRPSYTQKCPLVSLVVTEGREIASLIIALHFLKVLYFILKVVYGFVILCF